MQCAQQEENKRTLADTEGPVDVKQTCASPSGHGSPKRHKSGQGEVNISPGSSCQATTRNASSSDNIIYESGGFKISKVGRYENGDNTKGQTGTFDLPPEAPWKGKSRPALLVKCADGLPDAFNRLKDSFLGLHVAMVDNKVIALAFKTYEAVVELPEGYTMHKPSKHANICYHRSEHLELLIF